MSPLPGRVEAALARRKGGALRMARCRGAARRIWRRLGISSATGDTEIAPCGAIGGRSGSWGRAVRRVGGEGAGGGWAPGAQRVGQRRDRGLPLARLPAPVLLRTLPITAGITAGREDESGRGGRLGGEEGVLIEDDEAAIEELAQFHATAGVGVAAGAGRDLQPAGAQPHGVVAGDDARVAAAQDTVEIARRGAPRGRGRRGGAGEALNEGGQELWQKRVGLLEGVQGPQAQFADEAVLQSPTSVRCGPWPAATARR